MKEKWKKVFRDFCLNTSVLGLKYFYLYPNLISRIFWGVTMVMVSVFATIVTMGLYHRFLGMLTRITIENQFAWLGDTAFPAVTLCSPNQITISATQHLNRTLVDGNRSLDLDHMFRQLVGFYNLVDLDMESLNQLQDLIKINRYTVPEVMTLLPQPCHRFLKMCIFHGRIYPCSSLFQPILTQYGFCCIFNSMYSFSDGRRNEVNTNFQVRKVIATGIPQGLSVVTDFEPDDALNGTIVYSGSNQVMINAWNEFPANDEFSVLLPGAETFVVISATHTYCSDDVRQLSSDNRKCFFADERSTHHFPEYHNSDCDLQCLTSAVEEFCQCQMLYLPRARITHVCNISSIACLREVKLQTEWLTMDWEETYGCQCPRDCDSYHYKISPIGGNLNAVNYDLRRKPFQQIKFNKSTTIMHFFFANPVYTKKKQETVMSMTTLVSNVGGMFGLCLGISVISLVEMVYYTYCALLRGNPRRVRRRVYPAFGYYE